MVIGWLPGRAPSGLPARCALRNPCGSSASGLAPKRVAQTENGDRKRDRDRKRDGSNTVPFSAPVFRAEPGGWNRIQIEVDDLASTVDRMKEAGSRFRNQVVVGNGGKQILVEDPSGNPIELFEPARGADG